MLRTALAIALCTLVAAPAFAQKGTKQNSKREQHVSAEIAPAKPAATAEQRIRAALQEETNLEFVESPLKEALTYIADKHKIDVQYDVVALRDAAVDPTAIPVSINVHEIKLASALNLILRQNDLTMIIQDEVLQITTKDRANSILVMRVYDVHDLAEADNIEQLIGVLSSVPCDKDQVGKIRWLRLGGKYTLFVSKPENVHDGIQQVLADLRAVNAKPGQ
jgi:type II secretory pathway component HofQ